MRTPSDDVSYGNELFATSETYIHKHTHTHTYTHKQDLMVRTPSNDVSYGNELFATSETYNRYPEVDTFNNVERVVLPSPETGQHVVRITAPIVMTSNQEWVSCVFVCICIYVCLLVCFLVVILSIVSMW